MVDGEWSKDQYPKPEAKDLTKGLKGEALACDRASPKTPEAYLKAEILPELLQDPESVSRNELGTGRAGEKAPRRALFGLPFSNPRLRRHFAGGPRSPRTGPPDGWPAW
jgi:hypothetical protein